MKDPYHFFLRNLVVICTILFVPATTMAAETDSGELRIGTRVPLTVWGERDTFSVPSVSAGLSLAHAATLLQEAGLGERYDANAFFATAIKESRLGMAYGDGPFQIESGTAFEEMKRIFPGVFSELRHEEVIAYDAFETSALTKAYYDVFAVNMLDEFGYKAHKFIRNAEDSRAAVKIVSLAYNRGLWWNEFPALFQTYRERCLAADDLLECVEHDIADDHASAIARYTKRLRHPKRYGGRVYNPDVTWNQVEEYLTSIATFVPEEDREAVRTAARQVFDARSQDGVISFRYDAQVLIDVIIQESRDIPDPTKQIRAWY